MAEDGARGSLIWPHASFIFIIWRLSGGRIDAGRSKKDDIVLLQLGLCMVSLPPCVEVKWKTCFMSRAA